MIIRKPRQERLAGLFGGAFSLQVAGGVELAKPQK
jgi:hypothetical protein